MPLAATREDGQRRARGDRCRHEPKAQHAHRGDSTQLLHDVLLALLGYTGDIVVATPGGFFAVDDVELERRAIDYGVDVARHRISTSQRDLINKIAEAGFHYKCISKSNYDEGDIWRSLAVLVRKLEKENSIR